MVILHIARLDSFQASGVNAVVPEHVKNQRQYADAALWNIGEFFEINGLDQNFSAGELDALPLPYRRPDIAVFHEVYIPKFLSIAKQLRKLDIPYVVVPHSSLNRAAQKKSRLKKIPANLLLFKPFCEKAGGAQFLSKKELEDRVFGANPFIATNGIYPQDEVKTSFGKNGLRFVYIGRLQPYIKGLDIMIQAFAAQKEVLKANGCTLDIYGPDEDNGMHCAPVVRDLIKAAQAEDFITLHPAVFGDEKKSVLLESDIFIQTSRNDGMPMGILEALSYGLPCLVTDGTTLGELIESYGAGWRAETNADAVVAALERAVKERQTLSEKSSGALSCTEEFRWSRAAKTAVDNYGKICKKEQ